MNARFTHLNPGFNCENCGQDVQPLKTGCRNHCPHCLFSKHVDINPGDRANSCKSLMEPISYHLNSKKGIILSFQCLECGQVTNNKAALEDVQQPDSYDRILSLNTI